MKITSQIDLPKVIGKGYGAFWRSKNFYRVVKGSRGSKKSKTTALNFIVRILKISMGKPSSSQNGTLIRINNQRTQILNGQLTN